MQKLKPFPELTFPEGFWENLPQSGIPICEDDCDDFYVLAKNLKVGDFFKISQCIWEVIKVHPSLNHTRVIAERQTFKVKGNKEHYYWTTRSFNFNSDRPIQLEKPND